MSKYKVFQIQLSDDEYKLVNLNGHDSVPKQRIRLDIMFANSAEIGAMAAEGFRNGFYKHVANIKSAFNSLEHVFKVGNIGPEESIERLNRMSSVSVGDIIEDDAGDKWVVANFGFQAVG